MKEFIMELVVKFLDGMITDEMLMDVKVMFVKFLQDQVDKTENEIDDAIVDIMARFLEVEAPKVGE